MDTCWRTLNKNVILVSRDGSRPLLYAPLQGIAMEVNAAFVQRFERALQGDADSANALGMEAAGIEKFIQTPPNARHLLDPQWPQTFEPASATIFLTHKCTLRCSYCYCHGGEGADMPWPIFERAVRFTLDNARRQKRDLRLSFHGGDPGACWPYFQQCIAFIEQACGEAGVKPVLSIGTNGFYADAQAEYLAKHIDNATVSIDGSPEVHDLCRATAAGQPSLERTLRTVQAFEANRVPYSVRMTVTAQSLPRLAESVDFICRHTRTPAIRAEPLYARGRATASALGVPDPAQFVAGFRQASAVARQHGRLLTYSGARITGVFSSFCAYPAPTFGVTPEGNLTCCYEVLHPGDPLRDPFFYGHVPADGSGICVDETRVAAIRAGARQRREACAHCFCVFACAGDCAAKTMDEPLEGSETPGRCQITRALVHDMLRAALEGDNPLQPPPAAAANTRSDASCPCEECAQPDPALPPHPHPPRGSAP